MAGTPRVVVKMKILTLSRGFRRVWIVISGIWLVYWVQAFPMKCFYRVTLQPQWASHDIDYYTCIWGHWQWYYADLLNGGYNSQGAIYYTLPDLVGENFEWAIAVPALMFIFYKVIRWIVRGFVRADQAGGNDDLAHH